MKACKVVFVGDKDVGKTSLILSYTNGYSSLTYTRDIINNYIRYTHINNIPFNIGLWDTSSKIEYQQLKPLSYPASDLIILCFAINSFESFCSIKNKHYPEIKHHLPNVTIILVGTKNDLRDKNKKKDFITYKQGKDLAKELSIEGYYECSALLYKGIEEIFQEGLQKVSYLFDNTNKRRNTCIIL